MQIQTIIAVLFLSFCSFLAIAQPIDLDSILYQGELMDNGAPANGLYDFQFSLYDAEVGGTLIFAGIAGVTDVEVTDGRFECFIEFPVGPVHFINDDYAWLQIQVRESGSGDSLTQLSPRQRIVPTPKAHYAVGAGTSNFAYETAADLNDIYLNGKTITTSSFTDWPEIVNNAGQLTGIHLGSDDAGNGDGLMLTFNDIGNRTSWVGTSIFGQGVLYLYDNSSDIPHITSFLDSDISDGGGGYGEIKRNDQSEAGIVLEGNFNGTESPRIFLNGVSNDIQLDTSADGDDSVFFPAGAISPIETLAETGGAESTAESSTFLTQNPAVLDTIQSVTINCPANGYVLAIATAQVSITHITGTTSTAQFLVSDDPTMFEGHADIDILIESGRPTSIYYHPLTIHQLFPVQEGANTFYFIGNQVDMSASIGVRDKQFTAIFIPTAYGTVNRENGLANPASDQFAPVQGGLTPLDILTEQNAALQADNARQQRELDEMRARMIQIEQSLKGQQRRDPGAHHP